MSIGSLSHRSQDRISSKGICTSGHTEEWGPWEREDDKGTKYKEKLCAVYEIGRGGFGTVYKGHKCIFNRKEGQWVCIVKDQLAIKVVEPDHGKTGSTFKSSYGSRIARLECETHGKLTNSPYLVTPKMLPKKFSENSRTVFAMEYCTHGDLEKYMREQRLTHLRSDNEKMARKLVGSVVKGLKALREEGYFHRDIKASNIFVTGTKNDPIFKLGDLGLVAENKNQNRCLCGTPTAMAPEMNGRDCYDEKIDIWSLGILLYTKLFERKPFAFDPKDSTTARIKAQHKPLAFDKKISTEAKDLLVCMLQPDPIRRIDLNGIEKHKFLQNQFENNLISQASTDVGYLTTDSGFITSSTLLSGQTNVYATRTKYCAPTPMRPLSGLQESSQSIPVLEDRVLRPSSRMSQFNPSLSGIQPRGSVVPSTCLSRNGIVKPDRLNTKRVKCKNSIKTSQTSKSKILENGDVQMEITRLKKLLQNGLPTSIEEIETFCVSHDGWEISIKRSQKPEERYV